MANELNTKWGYPLTMVSQDKRVPLPGVMDGYAGELCGVDGSVQGGLRPFGGFKTVYELNFFSNPYHNEHSFVNDFFPVNFKIDYDAYGYGFIYRAIRQTSPAGGSVTWGEIAKDGDTIAIENTAGVEKTYRAYEGSTHGYSNGSLGKAEVRMEFLKEAVLNGSVTLISEDGFERTYKGVRDGSCTNGDYDPMDDTVLFNIGGTPLETIPDSQEITSTTGTNITTSTADGATGGATTTSTAGVTTTDTLTTSSAGETLQSSLNTSDDDLASGSYGTGTTDPATEEYLSSSGNWQPWEARVTRALSTLNITSRDGLNGKTLIFEDASGTTHTITFDNTRTVHPDGIGAKSTLTQIVSSASTLNGKTLIFQDAGGTSHTITFSNTVNQEASVASATVTMASTSLNSETVILEDSNDKVHTITFSSSVTQANSTKSTAGISGLSTTATILTSLKKSIDLAIAAGDIDMSATHPGSSKMTLKMTSTGTSGNGKTIAGTAISNGKITVTSFSGGASGSTASIAGVADTDGTTLFALKSVQKSLSLAKAAGSIGISSTNPTTSRASATFTFGDTEFNDANKGYITLTDDDGGTHTYSIRNDYAAQTNAKAEASFVLDASNFNSVNDAYFTLTDSAGVTKTYVSKNDYSAANREAEAELDLGDSKFDDLNYAEVTLVNAAGTPKTYRIRNDAGAVTSGKAAAKFTFDSAKFNDVNNATISIQDAAGTTKIFKIKNDYTADPSASVPEFEAGAASTVAAANFVAAVNAASINVTASADGSTVTMVQDTAGSTGNVPITVSHNPSFNTLCSLEPPLAFVGGGALEFNAGASAAVAAENLKIAINSSDGHNGTITATRSGNIVKLVQGTAGAAGNTTITINRAFDFNDVCDTAVPTSFVGGDYIEVNAGGSRDALGANLQAAINGSGQTIDATYSSGTMTLVQETAGAAGNTSIVKSSWDSLTSTNLGSAFTRGGYAEFNAGGSASVAAANFVAEVTKYQSSEILASADGAVVTLTMVDGGAGGNTSITVDSDWNSCIEGGSTPSTFTTGDRSTLELRMDTVGTSGNGKTITGTGISGSQLSATTFASGGLGSSATNAGILDADTNALVLSALRLSLNQAIEAGSIDLGLQGRTYGDNSYMKLIQNTKGEAGQGRKITGTAVGSPSSVTLTISSGTSSSLHGKTIIFPAPVGYSKPAHTMTFDNTSSQTSSTSRAIGIKDQTNIQGIMDSVIRSVKAASKERLILMTPAAMQDKNFTIHTDAYSTLFNASAITGTAISGGFLTQTGFSGGSAGTNFAATVFDGGHDVTPSDIAASEAASNLKAAINSKMGHNAIASANFTFGASSFDDKNHAGIELTDALGYTRQYTIRNDYGATTTSYARASLTFGDTEYNDVNNAVLTLEDTTGKRVDYKIKNDGTASAAKAEVNANVSANATATNLANAVNGFYGHNGTITAAADGATVTFTQTVSGTAGNTRIIQTGNFSSVCDAAPSSYFMGGGAIEFNAGANATVAAQNFVLAVNGSTGHNGSIKASNVDGVVTLIQQNPNTEALMERDITPYGSFNDITSVNVGSAFVLAESSNHRFTVETFSTTTSGATSPVIVITQKSTGVAGHTVVASYNKFAHTGNVSGVPTKFEGGDHVMFNAGSSNVDSGNNFNTALASANGHNNTVSKSLNTTGSSPVSTLTQVTNGETGNTLISIKPSKGTLTTNSGTDFTGGADKEGDIFMDFYHTRCGSWSYGNLIKSGVDKDSPMDVASTGRILVIGVKGEAPVTVQVTRMDCPASSSDATTTSDHCATTASYPPYDSESNSCFYNYNIIVETNPGPGNAPDFQGPQTCIGSGGDNEIFNPDSTFVTSTPSGTSDVADATLILCENMIDEGYYPDGDPIPDSIFLPPTGETRLIHRENSDIRQALGMPDQDPDQFLGESGTALTTDEDDLPEVSDVTPSGWRRLLIPEVFPTLQTAWQAQNHHIELNRGGGEFTWGSEISIGAGVYFPQPHGNQAKATVDINFSGTSPFSEGDYFTIQDLYGIDHKLIFTTDFTKRWEKNTTAKTPTATWTFVDYVEAGAEITLRTNTSEDGTVSINRTYRAYSSTASTYHTGDLDEDGNVVFLNGDDQGSSDAAAAECASNFKVAVENANSSNGHGSNVISVEISDNKTVTLTNKSVTGPTGETVIAYTTSLTGGDASSFIKKADGGASCFPIPPSYFSDSITENEYYVQVSSFSAEGVALGLNSAFNQWKTRTEWDAFTDSNNAASDSFEAEFTNGFLEAGSGPLATGSGMWSTASQPNPSSEPNRWEVDIYQNLVGELGNANTDNNGAMISSTGVSGGVAFTDFAGGTTKHAEGTISFVGVPADGAIVKISNSYSKNATQQYSFKFVASNVVNGSKDTDGNIQVRILDLVTAEQVNKALYDILDKERKEMKFRPVNGGTYVRIIQGVPGGGASNLVHISYTDKTASDWTSDQKSPWEAMEAADDIRFTNGNTSFEVTGDSTSKIVTTDFTGGTSTLNGIGNGNVKPGGATGGNQNAGGVGSNQDSTARWINERSGAFFVNSEVVRGDATVQKHNYKGLNQWIKGRYGPKNTVFDCYKMAGTFGKRATLVETGTQWWMPGWPYAQANGGYTFNQPRYPQEEDIVKPQNWMPFRFMSHFSLGLTKSEIQGFTVTGVGCITKLDDGTNLLDKVDNGVEDDDWYQTRIGTAVAANVRQASGTGEWPFALKFRRCFFYDMEGWIGTWTKAIGTTDQLSFHHNRCCNNRLNDQEKAGHHDPGYGNHISNEAHVDYDPLRGPDKSLWHFNIVNVHHAQHDNPLSQNTFAADCGVMGGVVLTDTLTISGGFEIHNAVHHIGILPGGVIYPGEEPEVKNLCLYDVETIPDGVFIDQLPVIKAFIYPYNDIDYRRIVFDVMIAKKDSDDAFNYNYLVKGGSLFVDDSDLVYNDEANPQNSWVNRVKNDLGGEYAAFVDYDGDGLPTDFGVEVDVSDLADNISNATAYQVNLNIAKYFDIYNWAEGDYKVSLRIRDVYNDDLDAGFVSSTSHFNVGKFYCKYGVNEEKEQLKDRKMLDAGNYVFAYQLFDSKSGRKSQLSKVLEVREFDFGELPDTSQDTSDPELVNPHNKYAILDLVYDSDKYDYAYIYRSVNAENAAGTFSAGVLSLDGLIKLSTYDIPGYPPDPTRQGFKRSAYIYKLGDLELVYQDTFSSGTATFDNVMPYGGALEWYNNTLLMSSIEKTPVSTTDTTGQNSLISLGELRWSSMTHRSPELFSPLDRYVPSTPSNEIINLTRVGNALIGFSYDRMYHIKKDGTGSFGYMRLLEMHEGFGAVGPTAADSVASTIYFLTSKGLKAVSNDGKLDDVRGFDNYITNEWSGTTLSDCSVAFDSASGVLYVLNPSKEEAACMWFNTARTSVLKDMNFTQVRKGTWPQDDADPKSSLVERAMFLQNIPTSSTAQDGVANYKPRICVANYDYSQTIANSGAGYNGQKRITMQDGQGDTRFTMLDNSGTSHPSGKSTLKINASSSLKLSDDWVGSYLYVLSSATGSLVGTKARITAIANAQLQTYTSGSGDTTITVEGTDFRSLAIGDRIGISPVYVRWVGHPLGMNSESGEKFAGLDYHRNRHLEGLGSSFVDVSGPPSTETSNTDAQYRALAFAGASLTPTDSTLIKDLNGVTVSSVVNGAATYWAAFGSDSSTIALQGTYGIQGPSLTPGIEVFCPDLDFRLLSVMATGKILATDRTSKGTVE
tara:strand:+ start:4072 stop:15234 length:11163 start_codon:yes stop_codon:yes gene_type:complete